MSKDTLFTLDSLYLLCNFIFKGMYLATKTYKQYQQLAKTLT